jgi:hypothetical protein
MGYVVLIPGSTYARLGWPTHPVGQARNLHFNSPMPHSVCDDSNIEKTIDFVLILVNSRFETKQPMVSFALLCRQLYSIQVIFWYWFCQVVGNNTRVDNIDAQRATIDGHVNID